MRGYDANDGSKGEGVALAQEVLHRGTHHADSVSLGSEAAFPAGVVCQPFQQPLEEASAGDFGYGEDLGVGGVVREGHRLHVYVVPHLRDAFSIVPDYCRYGTHIFSKEAADVVARAKLRVTRIVAAQLRAVNGWSAVSIGERLRTQVELAVALLLPETGYDRSIQRLVVTDVVAGAFSYSVSQRHSVRRFSVPSILPSSMSEKISGPHTLTYSTVSGWT